MCKSSVVYHSGHISATAYYKMKVDSERPLNERLTSPFACYNISRVSAVIAICEVVIKWLRYLPEYRLNRS